MLGSGASTPLEHVTWLAIKSPLMEVHENRSIDVPETSPDFTKTLDWQSETSSPSTSKIPKEAFDFNLRTRKDAPAIRIERCQIFHFHTSANEEIFVIRFKISYDRILAVTINIWVY